MDDKQSKSLIELLRSLVPALFAVCCLPLVACGPVNSKPADSGSAAVNARFTTGTPLSAVIFSSNHQFIVAIKSLQADPTPTTNSPADPSNKKAPLQNPVPTTLAPEDTASASSSLNTVSVPEPEKSKFKGKIGTSQFSLVFKHGSDLSAPSSNLNVAVQFEHTSAKIHEPFPAKVEAQADGSFIVTLQLTKAGTWTVHIVASEGDLNDASDFEIKL